jgi:hypothetical protein
MRSGVAMVAQKGSVAGALQAAEFARDLRVSIGRQEMLPPRSCTSLKSTAYRRSRRPRSLPILHAHCEIVHCNRMLEEGTRVNLGGDCPGVVGHDP